MEILSHFRTIEELTKTLSREQGLLSEMFEKRKLMKFPLGVALELVGGNEMRLRRLIDYGMLVETGNTIEIESDYLNFFEEVLNVNEEISVLSVQECINTLKEYIGYYLQETNINRKTGYQDSVRQLLKKTGFRTLKNVVDLKRNMDNAYKQEPNYVIKKKKLQNMDEKSHSIRAMIQECEKLIDNEQAFFLMANDPHMVKTCSDVKHDFVEAYHALMEIDRQIIIYINQIEQQNQLYKKIRKLKYLQDQLLIKTDTNLLQILESNNPRLDGVTAIQQDPPLAGNAKGERPGDGHSEADSGAQRTEEDGQDRGGTTDRRRPTGTYAETEGGGSYRGVECFFCVEPQSV